jgi:cardiolipin synthase
MPFENFRLEEMERIYRGHFAQGNRVELLWRGAETFRRIFETLRDAKSSICLEFYIFRADETGRELAQILKEKAREGVKVYVLYDHFGSLGTPMRFWRGLREAGVNVSPFHRFDIRRPVHYIHRDHRKLIIVDGRVAFTGGLNIANEYRGLHLRIKHRGPGWRDTGVLIRGPVVHDLLQSFLKHWKPWANIPLEIELPPPASEGVLPVLPIFAGSARGRRKLRRLLYYSINHARESILLTTAYFCPSKRMLETLEEAVNRGVKIKLLVPGISDVPAVYYAARAFYERLLKRGVEIYHYMGDVLHSKSYVFDSCWSIVGSANLDFQSLRWNDEGNVGILDRDFAGMLTELFYDDLRDSVQVLPETWKHRSLWGKVKERFFSYFRRRL